jgi:uncharacterized protein YhaN
MITIPDGMKRPAESRRDELERENAELKATLADIEEREAACCPEDVPFDELIPALRELIARLERKNAELKAKLESAQNETEFIP